MKLLNKLALTTAVAALSTASFAMEAMTDDSMAATTGQDGISLRIDTAAGLSNTAWLYLAPEFLCS